MARGLERAEVSFLSLVRPRAYIHTPPRPSVLCSSLLSASSVSSTSVSCPHLPPCCAALISIPSTLPLLFPLAASTIPENALGAPGSARLLVRSSTPHYPLSRLPRLSPPAHYPGSASSFFKEKANRRMKIEDRQDFSECFATVLSVI